MTHWRDQAPLPAKFWQNVQITDTCWNWTGAITSGGYGHISVNGKMVQAHRFAWEQRYGVIPLGVLICHHCDNRRCVRWDGHLFVGDHQANMADCLKKGRRARGEKNGWAVLNEEKVREIRDRYARGETQLMIARLFGCSQTTIHAVVHRKNWGHVP